MTEGWSMPADVQTRLEERFMLELGREGFWRQVERFIGEHVKRGTVDTSDGFESGLEGWLERADANRDQPKNSLAKVNGHAKPASVHLAPGINFQDWRERILRLYDQAIADGGGNRLSLVESVNIEAQANSMKIGKGQQIGIDRGETWTVNEVLKHLRIASPEAA